MFVVYSLVNPDGSVFSCGMHNLGLKDTIVYGEETQEAIDLINIFSYYQLVDKPEIFAGQTFASNANAPVFTIEDELDPPYSDDDVFTNPFGVWALERVEES